MPKKNRPHAKRPIDDAADAVAPSRHEKPPQKKLPRVISAPPELLAKMQRLFAQPPVSFEVMKAQTDAMLKDRNDASAAAS